MFSWTWPLESKEDKMKNEDTRSKYIEELQSCECLPWVCHRQLPRAVTIDQTYVPISSFHHTRKQCPETKSEQNYFRIITLPRAWHQGARHVRNLPSSATDVLEPGKFLISNPRRYIGFKCKMLWNLLMKTLRVACCNFELQQYKKPYCKMLCSCFFWISTTMEKVLSL